MATKRWTVRQTTTGRIIAEWNGQRVRLIPEPPDYALEFSPSNIGSLTTGLLTAKLETPAPTPIPEPVPTPDPTPPPPDPVPQPTPALSVPLRVVGVSAGTKIGRTDGILLPRGLLKDARTASLWSGTQRVVAGLKAIARWPDASIKSLGVSTLLTGQPYELALNAAIEDLPPASTTTLPWQLHATSKQMPLGLPVSYPSPEADVDAVRATVTHRGRLTDGQHMPHRAGFILRHTAYQGWTGLRVELTIHDTQQEQVGPHPQNPLELSRLALHLPWQATSATFGTETAAVTVPASTDPASLYQRGELRFKTVPQGDSVQGTLEGFAMSYRGVAFGEQAPGWLWVDGPDGPLGIAMQEAWREFPWMLTVTKDGLTLELHPQRYSDEPQPQSPPYFTRLRTLALYGQAQTWRLLVCPGMRLAEFQAVQAAFQADAHLEAEPAWSCDSGACGETQAAGPQSVGYDRMLIEGVYERSITQKDATGGAAIPYGAIDHGARYRPGYDIWETPAGKLAAPSVYQDTHVGATNFWMQALRTGDPRWRRLGLIATRHFINRGRSWVPRLGHWFNGSRVTPPGELLAIKHDNFAQHWSRNAHTGHEHVSGLAEYALLTNDPLAFEVLRRAGDWYLSMVDALFPADGSQATWADAERDFAWPIHTVRQVYRATGDRKYHELAVKMVKSNLAWWKTKKAHTRNGQVVGQFDWEAGTGCWSPKKSDNDPVGWNGPSSWYSGACASNVILTLKDDADYGLLDRELVTEMLCQVMNAVCKFGFREDTGRWYYSESAMLNKGTVIDASHIYYPLAWAHQAVPNRPNPAIYDTSPLWEGILARFDAWAATDQAPGFSTDSGWYGYESIFPADYWRLRAP